MSVDERKLRMVLKANAAFSLINGLALVVFHHAIASLMNVANASVLLYVGMGLVLFAILVGHTAFRKSLAAKQVQSIIFQDWLWVVASFVVIGIQAWQLNDIAYWLIGIVALLVADFAIFQMRFLKRL